MTALARVLDALATTTGTTARGSGRQHMARCPAHEDNTASLSVTDGTDRVLLKCHAGCDNTDILAAIKLTYADLFNERRTHNNGTRSAVTAEYRYLDEAGTLLYVVERHQPKTFRQKRPDGAGWIYKMGNVRRVLYRLPELLAAVKDGRIVYVVEGEKDADRLTALGLPATCNVGGAGKWRDEYAHSLAGADVVVITDMDTTGRAHADAVVASLRKAGIQVRLAEPCIGKDITDHLDAGGGIDDIVLLGNDTTQDADPPANRRLEATPASTMRMRAPTWLADKRIPTSAITLLGGREGIGKSTISYDLAARITRGDQPGRYLGHPRAVGVVASEDSWESVILPRLVAAKADLTRVFRVDARTEEGALDAISVPADLDRLATLCDDKGIVLVVLDPLMSVIHASLDTHKDREVRQALDPLARFATVTGVAVLGLIHVNKTATTDALNSIMASRAFTAIARSVLYCILDPEADREDRYLFGHPKSSYSPRQPTVRYHLVEVTIELADPTEDEDAAITTSAVVWDGDDDRSIRDAMESSPTDRADSETTIRIVDWLTEQGRPVATKEIIWVFPDLNPDTLRKHLSRLVKRGKLVQPIYGHYTLPDEVGHPHSLGASPDSSASTDTSASTPMGQKGFEAVEALVQSPREGASTPQTPLPPWAADAYDRESP